MKRFLVTLVAFLMVVAGVQATITVPFSFTPFTTISSSQVNTNFSTIASQATDKRGDTLTGTLNTQVLLPDVTATRNIGSASFTYLNAWFGGTVTANALALTTPLNIAFGGTNSAATPTAGGVGYGTGSAHAYSTAGTAGQYLVSNGAGAPAWSGISSVFNAGNTGSSITLNFATNGLSQKVTRNASTTITLTAPALAQTVLVELIHDGTSNTYTVAFSPAVKFPSGATPPYSQTAGAVDLISLVWDGANWYGIVQVAFS